MKYENWRRHCVRFHVARNQLHFFGQVNCITPLKNWALFNPFFPLYALSAQLSSIKIYLDCLTRCLTFDYIHHICDICRACLCHTTIQPHCLCQVPGSAMFHVHSVYFLLGFIFAIHFPYFTMPYSCDFCCFLLLPFYVFLTVVSFSLKSRMDRKKHTHTTYLILCLLWRNNHCNHPLFIA